MTVMLTLYAKHPILFLLIAGMTLLALGLLIGWLIVKSGLAILLIFAIFAAWVFSSPSALWGAFLAFRSR